MLVPVAFAICCAGARAADDILVIDALAELRAQGYQIFYSNDLVTPSQRIDLAVVDLDSIQAALERIGLKLSQSGDIWMVVRDGTAVAALAVRLIASDGKAISVAEFQFSGQRQRHVVRADAGVFVMEPPERPIDSITIRVRDHYPRTLRLRELAEPVVMQPIDRIETVIVTGSRHVVPGGIAIGSAAAITQDEMTRTPALAGDSMRVTNRLPGMSSVGISAKPLVRGGVQDETLTLLDGVELLDPFHLADFQSLFSLVDARIVEQIDVYTGAFPARYGNRMSGVVDIATPSQELQPRTELGVSVLAAFANTRGISDDRRIDWLASARHGNLEYLADLIDPQWGKPTFDDAYARVGWRVNEDVKAYLGAFAARDDVSITEDDSAARSDIETAYWWTRIDVMHSELLHSSTQLSYVASDRAKNQRNVDADFTPGFLDYSQQLRKVALRSDFSYAPGRTLMEFGIGAEFAESRYDSIAVIDRGPIGVLLGSQEIDAFDIHTDPSGWSGAAYWSGEFWLTERVALQPGIRWDFQDYYTDAGVADQVSPRLGIRWDATDTSTMRLSVGRYCQPQGIHEMKVNDGVDHFYSPQRSNHAVVGADWFPRPSVRIGVEAYYKDYGQARTRFENLFNTFVLVPELEPDRVAIPISRARVRGVDAQARFDITQRVSLVWRYSYMDADDRIGGVWEPRAWSQHHTVQGMLAWTDENWTAAAAVTWHSGWRTTQLPASVPVDTQLPLAAISDRNLLNDYLSLDLNVSRSWRYGRATITAQADLTNALNRTNHGGNDYTVEETATDVLLTPTSENLLPWVPTAGVSIAF